MRPARSRPRLAAVLPRAVLPGAALLLALAASGCSPFGAGDAEPETTPTPGISIPAELTLEVRGPAPSPSPSASQEPSPSPSPSGSAPGEATCDDLRAAWNDTNRALVDLSPEHPRALVASFRDAHRAATSVEPPAAIEDAWGTMSDYLGDVVGAFEDVDTDDAAAVTSAMTHTVDAADTARATAAGETVTAYLADSCGA